MAGSTYEVVRGALRCSFDCPDEWRPRDVGGERAPEVFISGPPGTEQRYPPYISVRARPAEERDAGDIAEEAVARHAKLDDFRDLGRAREEIAGRPAIVVDLAYSLRLPLKSREARQTPIRERRVVFRQDDLLYEIVYSAAEAEYLTWLPAFETVLRTLRIRGPV
jgi:hypothetical protein